MVDVRKSIFICRFLISLGLAFPLHSLAQSKAITVVPTTKLALSYSATKYHIEEIPGESGGYKHDLTRLKTGNLHVIWNATSEYLETEAQAVRIPPARFLPIPTYQGRSAATLELNQINSVT